MYCVCLRACGFLRGLLFDARRSCLFTDEDGRSTILPLPTALGSLGFGVRRRDCGVGFLRQSERHEVIRIRRRLVGGGEAVFR